MALVLPYFVLPQGLDAVHVVKLVCLQESEENVFRVMLYGVVFLFFAYFSLELGDFCIFFLQVANSPVKYDPVGMAIFVLDNLCFLWKI